MNPAEIKTSYTIFGLIFGYAGFGIIGWLSNAVNNKQIALFFLIFYLGCSIFFLYYCLKIYPDIFKLKCEHSAAFISFFNGVIGGVFGLLWNYNIRNWHRGISCYVIAAGYIGLFFLGMFS